MALPHELIAALDGYFRSIASDWAASPDVVWLAARHGVLPLVADMGGIAGMRPDGRCSRSPGMIIQHALRMPARVTSSRSEALSGIQRSLP